MKKIRTVGFMKPRAGLIFFMFCFDPVVVDICYRKSSFIKCTINPT